MRHAVFALANLEDPVGAQFGREVERRPQTGDREKGKCERHREQPRGLKADQRRARPGADSQHGRQRERHCDSAISGQEEALLGVAQDRVGDEMERGALQRMRQQPSVYSLLECPAQPPGTALGALHTLHHPPRVPPVTGQISDRESHGGNRQTLPRQLRQFVEMPDPPVDPAAYPGRAPETRMAGTSAAADYGSPPAAECRRRPAASETEPRSGRSSAPSAPTAKPGGIRARSTD